MKVRVISAIVAFAILIPIICLGGYPYAIVMGILSILAYKEVLDLKKSHNKIPNLIKIIGMVVLLYLILGNYGIYSLSYSISYSRILLPVILMLIPTIFYDKKKYSTSDAFYMIGSIFLLGLIFNLLIVLRNINVYLLVYLLSIAVLTDTFAFAIGCLIGKHKLLPSVSPKKTWEGALAGLIGGTAISLIIYINLVGDFSIKLLFITLALSIIGQIGDLVYSRIKRENEIKDFSNIVPGHGGILDRIDSLSFTIFAYVIILWFL